MKKVIKTQIEINASASTIWEALTRFSEYNHWNPFIQRIDGKLEKGKQLNVKICPPGGTEMKFKPTIIELEPNRKLSWLGKLGLRGIFDGKHEFIIEAIDENKCIFHQNEYFAGVLVLLLKSALKKTELGFIQMNEAIKKAVEK